MAVTVKDASGTSISLKSTEVAGEQVIHHIIEELPGTAEADIAAIKAAIEILDNAISGTEMQVDVVSSTLPSGAATAALQTTGNTALGTTADAEAEGNGSIIAVLKRLRTLLNGGLPAALGSGGGVKTDIQTITQPTAIYTGRLTLAATGVAEALGAEQALTVGVTIKALAANSAAVDVGGSGAVADSAFPLAANEETLIIIDDLSKIYVVGTAGDGVAYHAE